MFLTSWLHSIRHAFQRNRRLTRRTLRQQRGRQRRVLMAPAGIERLEDRTLLTSLVVQQPALGFGISLTNQDVDTDLDGVADLTDIVIESLTIDANSGAGVSIVLSGETTDVNGNGVLDPLVLGSLTIESSAIQALNGAGVSIVFTNVQIGSIVIDTSSVAGGGSAAGISIILNGSLVTSELAVTNSTASATNGRGLTVRLDGSDVRNPNIASPGEFTAMFNLANSTFTGASLTLVNGSFIEQSMIVGNTINRPAGLGAAGPGLSLNLTDSDAPAMRIAANQIAGVGVNLTRSPLLKQSPADTGFTIDTNVIRLNSAGGGIDFNLTDSNLETTILGNTIQGNAGHGIRFQTLDTDPAADSLLVTGRIEANTIDSNAGDGIRFSPVVQSNVFGAFPTIFDFGTAGGRDGAIRGNTISNNTGAGINAPLTNFVDFVAEITGNRIGPNSSFGINVDAQDLGPIRTVNFDVVIGGPRE
ncbi:MAG TPA: hypothetical protein VML55_08960, partial [Planctomycetaceae bacterium]|nr:hypothetical protein [Planctomycetaceae bacterium]